MTQHRLTLLLCGVQMLAMAGSLTFQALIPVFITEWSLSNTEAAWIGGASYVGYALAAPLLVALTDRIDAKRMVLAACLLGGMGGLGFALFAQGFWSAMGWRLLTGIAVAGSYMPGLKALSDRLPEGAASGRPQALYSATFSLASATSLFLAATLTEALGWPAAFAFTGCSCLAGAALVLTLPAKPPQVAAGSASTLMRLGAVITDRPTMRYILAYACHAWEMFAFRTWIVAFLAFAASQSGTGGGTALVGTVATVLVLAGLPAGIIGNELAARTDRKRGVAALMAAAVALAAVLALSTGQMATGQMATGQAATGPGFVLIAFLALAYGAVLMADNSAILVGTIQSSPAERRGAAIATQTFLAATMALISPLAIGAVLDSLGAGATAWSIAFLVMGLGPAIGALVLLAPLAGRRDRDEKE